MDISTDSHVDFILDLDELPADINDLPMDNDKPPAGPDELPVRPMIHAKDVIVHLPESGTYTCADY